jgi:hypothetical protein
MFTHLKRCYLLRITPPDVLLTYHFLTSTCGGTLENVVYRRKPATLAVFWEEIETACAAIHVDNMVIVAQAAVRRNQKCLDADGNHIEYWSAPRSGLFNSGKDPVPIVQEAGWAPGPVWTCAKKLAPTGIFYTLYFIQYG